MSQSERTRLREENKRLRRQNETLGEQVKLLVQMERQLHSTRRQLEDQLRQISALNEFSLRVATAHDVAEVVSEALDLVLALHPFHRALAVVHEPGSEQFIRIDKRPRSGMDTRMDIQWSMDTNALTELGTEPLFLERSHRDDTTLVVGGKKARIVISAMATEDGAYDDWNTALLLPLTGSNSNSFGCLWAINCTDQISAHHGPFGREERPMLEVFRRHLVAAIDQTSFHTQLETRVEKRTDELANALAQLEQSNEQLEREMSDRIRVERALARMQKLESLGQLTASLGHEINNPLAYLLANLEYISRQMKLVFEDGQPLPREDVREALEEAKDGADRIVQLVQDINEFTVDESVTLSPVYLGPVIDNAIKLVGKKVRNVATLHCEFPQELPIVRGQTGMLEQVLVNLLLNAAEAIDVGDSEANQVTISVTEGDDQMVELMVRDTGCGIDQKSLSKVFEPFYSTKVSTDGSGLGLFVCHSLVTSMTGELSIDSTPGEGTSVRVRLPRESGPVQEELNRGAVGGDRTHRQASDIGDRR